VLDDLDDQQRAAAECLTGPVVIHAGAGTGKTRTIINRIAHGVASGVYQANQTMAVTYTNRAAGEMRSRLLAMGVTGVQVRTFHSAALRQVQHFYPQIFRKDPPRLLVSKVRAVEQAVGRCLPGRGREFARDVAAEIEWAKVNMMSPEAYRSHSLPRPLDLAEVSQVYQVYLDDLGRQGAMDFEDVLLLATAMLTNYSDVAADVHRQYRHFTVDEFQDVSPVQFELLRAWLGGREDICVVGDPAQTIYSFSGATSDYLLDFERHFPRARHFALTHSYRSSPQVLELANAVMAAAPRGQAVRLDTTAVDGPAVLHIQYDTDADEAQGIADWIAGLIRDGLPAREIAVLFRINSQSEPIESALQDAGIPYTVRGGQRFFERPEIRQALALLRAAGAGDIAKPLPEIVGDIVRGAGWSPQPASQAPAQRGVWESLQTVVDLAAKHAQNADTNVATFVAALNARAAIADEPTVDAVTLASIHSAKGLEWDAVAIAGCSEGLLPISHAVTPDTVAEERRVLYVAITRAKRHLLLSWALRRATGAAQRSRSLLLPN
jgi:DNA helicase-2/ATP-dependent DNA helicase PcrA